MPFCMRTSLLHFAFLLTALLPALQGLGGVGGLQAYPALVCGNTYNGTFADNPVVPAYPGAVDGLFTDTFVLQVPVAQYYQVRGLGPDRVDIRVESQGTIFNNGPSVQTFLSVGSYHILVSAAWYEDGGAIRRPADYGFVLACSNAPFPTFQALTNLVSVALGQRVQGSLAGRADALRDYEYDWNTTNAQGSGTGLAGGYWPGADQAFSFAVPARGLVRAVGPQGSTALGGFGKFLAGPATNTLVGGTPAGATNFTEAAAILEPGTRYIAIEQGSTTTGQPFDFTLVNTCIPEGGANLASGLYEVRPVCCGEQTYPYLTAPGYYFAQTAFACTLGQALTLGLIDNGPSVPTPFVRVYLDLNRDGDYTDAGEVALPSTSLVGTARTFSLTLPTTSAVYLAAAGTRVPMRVQMASTALAGSPCDALPNGTTLDAFLQISPGLPYRELTCNTPLNGQSNGSAPDTLTFVHDAGSTSQAILTSVRFTTLNGHNMQLLNGNREPISPWAPYQDFAVIGPTSGRYFVVVEAPANPLGAQMPPYTLLRTCTSPGAQPGVGQFISGTNITQINVNQRVQGNLAAEADKAWNYLISNGVNPATSAYQPGRDKQYGLTLQTGGRITVRPAATPAADYERHRYVLLTGQQTLSGVAISPATASPAFNGGVYDASALLPAGTYYVSVEQGSATTNEAFDFAVKQFCTPVASAPVTPGTLFVNGFAAGPVNLTNATGYRYTSEPIALTVGQAATFSLVNSIGGGSSLFNRALIDFNDDGQFDPATEAVALSNAIAPNWTVQVLISPFNTAARAAWGRQVSMRIQGSSSSLATTAGCANLATGYTADYEVRLTAPAPAPPVGSFGFAQLREVKGAAGADRYTRVRLAPDGSTYACGSFTGTATFSGGSAAAQSFTAAGGTDGMLVRYTPQGNLAWVCRFSSTGNDEALGLGVDRLGNAYVCGFFTGSMTVTPASGPAITLVSAGGEDGFVARVLPDGRIQWIFRTGAEGNDRNNAIDVTPNFRFYLAGSFVGRSAMGGAFGTVVNLTSRGNADAFLARFTEVGSMFWVVQVGGPGNDFGFGAATDASGNGYLLGSYEGTATYTASNFSTTVFSLTSAGGSDGFVASVDGNGVRRWVQEIKGPSNEVVRDVAMDPNGGALVAVGAFSNTATFGPFTLSSRGFNDGFAFRLSTGTVPQVQWARRIGGFGQDRALGVRIDRQGNPIVTGNFAQTPNEVFGAVGTPLTSVGGLDGYLAKLERNSGLPLYLARFGGAGDEESLSADTAAGGGAVIAGSYQQTVSFAPMPAITSAGFADGFIASYLYNPTSTPPPIRLGDEAGGTEGTPAATALRVYPNPTSGRFTLLFDGAGRLQAFATDGRLVLDQPVEAGQPVEADLAPGIYQLRLRTEAEADRTTRLVVQ